VSPADGGFAAEAVYEIPAHGEDRAPLSIAIAKAGGGTVGRAYSGAWRAVVHHGRAVLHQDGELITKRACDHQEAARELAALIPAAQGVGDLAERLAAFASGESTPRTIHLAQETS